MNRLRGVGLLRPVLGSTTSARDKHGSPHNPHVCSGT